MASTLFGNCLPKTDFFDAIGAHQLNSSDFHQQYAALFFNHTLRNGTFNVSTYHDNPSPNHYNTVHMLLKVLHSAVCIFGLLGNILTMLILTRKRLKMSWDGTELTVHMGLVALAVSDFLLCLALLPYSILKNNAFTFSSKSFQLIYETYSNAFINTFLLTSTWLTVTIATSRYLAICHPFKARHMIGLTGTKVTIFAVFITCALFNIPRLFQYQIDTMDCHDGRTSYFKVTGYLRNHNTIYTIYMWLYFIFGITIPLCTLAFCNFCLTRVLHESSKVRKRSRVPSSHVDANYRITSILVTIVVMYISLVSPSEIFLFVQRRLYTSHQTTQALMITVEVTNLLQIVNFSCNFVLYFVLNKNFRRAMRDMFCVGSSSRRNGSDMVIKFHQSKISLVKSKV